MPYNNDRIWEGRIYLFDSHNISVEQITKFSNYLQAYQVATTKNQVDYFIYHCQFYNFRFLHWRVTKGYLKFLIWILDRWQKVALQKPIDWFNFIIFFAGPDPPEWRKWAFVAYFKGKLYHLGGKDPKICEDTNHVDVRRSNENPWNNLFRF